jgi:hypothetical protein
VYPASLQNVSGSAQETLCAKNNAQRETEGLPSPIKQESRHKVFTMSAQHKNQTKEKNPKPLKKLNFLHCTENIAK